MDYEAKAARKADREFNGAEYVRNKPPGPMLALLNEVYASDDRRRCRGMGGALAQHQTVRV